MPREKRKRGKWKCEFVFVLGVGGGDAEEDGAWDGDVGVDKK